MFRTMTSLKAAESSKEKLSLKLDKNFLIRKKLLFAINGPISKSTPCVYLLHKMQLNTCEITNKLSKNTSRDDGTSFQKMRIFFILFYLNIELYSLFFFSDEKY